MGDILPWYRRLLDKRNLSIAEMEKKLEAVEHRG
jgi:hypothetical protein